MTRIRVALAGCGSVSEHYLNDMTRSPYAEVVSVCDTVSERATQRAAQFGVPNSFDNFDAMLAGPPFDLFINTSAMQSHFPLNLKALQAGKHVHSEKPLATTLEEGRRLLDTARNHGVRLFAAPNVVTSPAFRCIAEVVASGEIGPIYAAHGCYGHGGPSWGPWFYRKGGGCIFDLAVYNITLLTGLLGPARSVMAMTGTAILERIVDGERIRCEADDNAMLLLEHSRSVFTNIQTGFVYGPYREDRTVEIIGTRGSVNLLGWDWAPKGVEVYSERTNGWEVRCVDQQGYDWSRCGSYVCEWLATGKLAPMTAEHAFHVLEVMLAAHESSATGRRIEVESTFTWPLFHP